ncbi:protein-glutamate methylesterase/protein-glutamine glutaminase [Solicola sp. PLA-1-18]|uniref:protein-glutamate methylesterase/protein-glutamine glutaminase n=1 Tax=Solicola sp. PLA-1-18 TaxID=3380532 RepID=UPI003BA3B4C5
MSNPTVTRVLVVDDTAVVRHLVTTILEQNDDIEVVGSAADGRQALVLAHALRPDVITLDVEMPVMDGLETVRELRAAGNSARVIMFSTLTDHGAAVTLDALDAGADDFALKPSAAQDRKAAFEQVRQTLVSLVRQWGAVAAAAAPSVQTPATRSTAIAPAQPVEPPKALVIGTSTGGPSALAEVVPRLPASFPVPVLVVQHMPPVFTRSLAERLNRDSALTVREAADGDEVEPGTVLVAPGGHHLGLHTTGGRVVVRTNLEPAENSCRPAVDHTMRHAVDAWGGHVLAVVLTGMGADGALGCQHVADRGGQVIVQDEATSVVWGMPGSVVSAGTACTVRPLSTIADEILMRVGSLTTVGAPS